MVRADGDVVGFEFTPDAVADVEGVGEATGKLEAAGTVDGGVLTGMDGGTAFVVDAGVADDLGDGAAVADGDGAVDRGGPPPGRE
ncbi:hypothetical protein [Microbispora bryophytorum]|uniref:Uncharacterized protein n=1 Tax=Microbispora bryophytorum TaxID=1460882 RepID=A0A8H9H981_9ACTN|nr:hypothetical protein [Microbispora bryophytorum]MBD3140292.1 hypothetical protein [Microbispora bryophytorum]TQS02010.1 hypothetical protein FLX07_30105 [Microbispora bryophytorum]GGO26623.1 hypothetical protein GCM10011574_59300 [Microbispora bryophytorum]